MIFRKIVVTAAIACLVLAFTACGDDDSSSFVSPEKETSSSIAESSSERSGGDPSSPSSSSSSAQSSSKNSSSSAKSSSSTDSKSSGGDSSPASSSVKSSSSVGKGISSSSADFLTILEENPTECDDEGLYSYVLYEGVSYRLLCQNGFLVYSPESSSSSVKSSSSYFDMSKQYREGPKYGTFVDPRDNQEYRTITVEKQAYNRTLVILASNLNYGKMVTEEAATYSDATVEKFCYNDDPWYCENGFGGLYTWSEAMGLPRACDTVALGSTPECPEATGIGEDGRRQGICPDGWHVMNESEWRMMPTSEGFGAKPMLSKVFDGDDDIGLAVLLGGGYYRGKYDGLGINIDFWVVEESSNKEYASTFANTTGVSAYSSRKVNFSDIELKLSKLPVRCVKDY